jgi:hypothetical protein
MLAINLGLNNANSRSLVNLELHCILRSPMSRRPKARAELQLR